MAGNSLITPTIIAREAMYQFENALVMAPLVHKTYLKEFKKIGDTVTIRKPVNYNVRDGQIMDLQDTEEGSYTLQINKFKGVDMYFGQRDMTLSIEDFSERYIKPAATRLANQVDSDLLALYADISNHVGTPGTTPGDFDALALAMQRLDDFGVDQADRSVVMNPAAFAKIAGSQVVLLNQARNEKAMKSGSIGDIAGFTTYKSQLIRTHTVGTAAGTPLVHGASQNVTWATAKATSAQTYQDIIINGFDNTKTLVAGDVITLALVYAVNPITGDALPFLREFTVVSAVTTDSGGSDTTVRISPAIITSGPYKTCSAAPADAAPVSFITGTKNTGYAQNIAFHKNAFALVVVPIEESDAAKVMKRISNNGLSLMLTSDFDIINFRQRWRLDIMYATKTINPGFACRVTG